MTKIRATCPDCGTVEFGVAEIAVVSSVGQRRPTSYRFNCPSCLQRVDRPAKADVVELLLSVGVPADEIPAFTHDDLDRFQALLESDDWLQSLTRKA
jgi:hypothetical protein